MIQKQKILLIIIAVLILILGVFNVSRLVPESKNYQVYEEALNEYNSSDFSKAYHTFAKVSRFSKLKPAALYRQALCADKLGDVKSEIKKYKDVIQRYPDSMLGLKAKYLKAQQYYESGNFKKAKKEFKEIINNNPKSDYAIASQYYLGLIATEKLQKIVNKKRKLSTQNKAVKYFRAYLKNAPTGRFALDCAQKWVSLGTKLNNEDNLLIAKVYQDNSDYKNAQKYLEFTNLSVSWPYFVKNAYALKDYSKVKYYTEQGLKSKNLNEVLINEYIDEKTENKNIYDAIDNYLSLSDSPKISISYLLSISKKSKGYDYLLYKSCNYMPIVDQTACFNTLYYEFPKGQFAAESLANIFYGKVRLQKYFSAKKIGEEHLSKFPNSNSAPKVMFWLAKIAQRTKNYEESRNYFKRLIMQYPDDYYAYHAFLNLNRFRHFNIVGLNQQLIEFPYKNSGYGLLKELVKVKDYSLINQLYIDDEFIQSWLAYLQGNFSTSARIARDAMEKLPHKPPKSDPRWKLVYPIHYYNEINQSARYWVNDPVLILSIIREESYFNPKAKSAVGASGLMQLMPATAREAGNTIGMSIPNDNLLFDPDINIRLGNVYYAGLKKSLWNKDIFAVLAYNGGLGSVSRWEENLKYVDVDDFVEQIPYPETQNYFKKVYRSYWNYIRIYDGIRF